MATKWVELVDGPGDGAVVPLPGWAGAFEWRRDGTPTLYVETGACRPDGTAIFAPGR